MGRHLLIGLLLRRRQVSYEMGELGGRQTSDLGCGTVKPTRVLEIDYRYPAVRVTTLPALRGPSLSARLFPLARMLRRIRTVSRFGQPRNSTRFLDHKRPVAVAADVNFRQL